MNYNDNTHPMLLEYLPTELFLQIFSYFSLQEIVTAFSGLNSYINSLIESVRNVSHVVKYNDIDAINLLQSFPTQISRLVIFSVEKADFTSLVNLRSLTLKYGTPTQLDTIRPEYFPLLEILHITGFRRARFESRQSLKKLLDVIFMNGFPRLRIYTMYNNIGSGSGSFSNTWTGSTSLRALNLCLQMLQCEQLRSICPRLRRLTTHMFKVDDLSLVTLLPATTQLSSEIQMLECLEFENKIIIDVNPFKPSHNQIVPPRFNNTTIVQFIREGDLSRFQVRILPQSEPYCHASFLIEIRSPPEYPFTPPVIIFLDPIYHPSVDHSGNFCICKKCTFIEFYKPSTMLVEIIEHVIHTIDNIPDCRKVLNNECFEEYENDYSTFHRKALEFTLSYGRPRN